MLRRRILKNALLLAGVGSCVLLALLCILLLRDDDIWWDQTNAFIDFAAVKLQTRQNLQRAELWLTQEPEDDTNINDILSFYARVVYTNKPFPVHYLQLGIGDSKALYSSISSFPRNSLLVSVDDQEPIFEALLHNRTTLRSPRVGASLRQYSFPLARWVNTYVALRAPSNSIDHWNINGYVFDLVYINTATGPADIVRLLNFERMLSAEFIIIFNADFLKPDRFATFCDVLPTPPVNGNCTLMRLGSEQYGIVTTRGYQTLVQSVDKHDPNILRLPFEDNLVVKSPRPREVKEKCDC
eukprot:TRINITY_DN14160_c0_g1_i1.p1 TRINITY_DN14160_c0_g1~~TRINITY_DN14160_c0_g1_i1.p1  ORF type:complete len:298 (-),score=49.74 TRINITY_DN14160_c0_g1_i1:75-968(-)